MSYAERREAILEVLCIRRHDTYRNLAFEFQVSRETIRQDIAVLMCSYPIETVRGRYGGGVKIADGFYLYRKKLTARQGGPAGEIRRQSWRGMADAGCNHLHTDYEQEPILLFFKVQCFNAQGANWRRILSIVARSSPVSCALNFTSSAACRAVSFLR